MDAGTLGQIISFYYQDVNKKLSTGKLHCVNVPNLGIFTMKLGSVIRKIARTEKFVEKLAKSPMMQAFAIRMDKQKELADLYALREKLEAEKARKKEIKQLREDYEKRDNALEREGQDPRGDQE
jgi:hypothetical protein